MVVSPMENKAVQAVKQGKRGTCSKARQQIEKNGHEESQKKKQEKSDACGISVLRLKMLFVAAKIVIHSDQTKIRYSIHDARVGNIIDFMKYLDEKRMTSKEWDNSVAARYYRKAG